MFKLILYTVLICIICLQFSLGHDRVPPMVAPSHYDTQGQNFQPPPPPVNGQPQGFGGQPQVQQYAQNFQQPSQHVPHAAQVNHGHPQTQNVLHGANLQHEKQHIVEHMEVPLDTSKMSDQELQFHYFKMHDNDNNNKLDGTELIKSLIHWHEQGHETPQAQHGQQAPQPKLFSDEELMQLIDPILKMDDANQDGYIDYTEFIRAQQKAAAP